MQTKMSYYHLELSLNILSLQFVYGARKRGLVWQCVVALVWFSLAFVFALCMFCQSSSFPRRWHSLSHCLCLSIPQSVSAEIVSTKFRWNCNVNKNSFQVTYGKRCKCKLYVKRGPLAKKQAKAMQFQWCREEEKMCTTFATYKKKFNPIGMSKSTNQHRFGKHIKTWIN